MTGSRLWTRFSVSKAENFDVRVLFAIATCGVAAGSTRRFCPWSFSDQSGFPADDETVHAGLKVLP